MSIKNSPEHEALCRRCGQSCHFAVEVNDLPVILDDLHCQFLEALDDGRFQCSVYEERFSRAPWCHTVEDALKDGLLANDCPYAQNTPGYQGKHQLHPRLVAKVEPKVRDALLENGAPIGVTHTGLRRFLDRTGGGNWRFVEDHEAGLLRIEPA